MYPLPRFLVVVKYRFRVFSTHSSSSLFTDLRSAICNSFELVSFIVSIEETVGERRKDGMRRNGGGFKVRDVVHSLAGWDFFNRSTNLKMIHERRRDCPPKLDQTPQIPPSPLSLPPHTRILHLHEPNYPPSHVSIRVHLICLPKRSNGGRRPRGRGECEFVCR